MAKKTTAKTSNTKAETASADNIDSGLFPPHPALSSEFLEAFSEGDTSSGEYSELLESICGATDDSQPVEQYNGTLGVTQAFVNGHQSSVAQVQWNSNLAAKFTSPGDVNGVRWGTGTMISNDLFITAGHLFDQTGGGWTRPKDNVTHATISPQEIALNMHLNFNFQVDPAGNLRTEVSFPITQLIEYRLGGLDFAICRIGGNPGASFGINGVSTVDAAVNDMLCIMGHPAGVPKRIEAGPCSNISGNNIFYNDIDTLGGNSGSGILRASTGLLVGVHTNGGCTSSGGENMGFRIVAIRGVSPTLQALPAPGPTSTILDNIHTSLSQDLLTSTTGDTPHTTVFADTSASQDLLTTVTADQPHTSVFADSSPTADVLTTVTADQPHTLATLDNPTTSVVQDVLTTTVADQLHTLAVLDSPRTNVFLDSLGTNPAADQFQTRKNLDDVKMPGHDKPIGDVKIPGSDGPGDPFDPGFDPGIGSRPFILATPHHIPTPADEAAAVQVNYESALGQLAQAIQQSSAELEALHQQYQQTLAEYQAMFGHEGNPN
jgi:V8-like Glu-specific endopeptidase